jgi:hypothetical protein
MLATESRSELTKYLRKHYTNAISNVDQYDLMVSMRYWLHRKILRRTNDHLFLYVASVPPVTKRSYDAVKM